MIRTLQLISLTLYSISVVAINITSTEGETTTFNCSVTTLVPLWRVSSTTVTLEGDPAINPAINDSRYSIDGNGNLVISDTRLSDATVYSCQHTTQGSVTFYLTVLEITTPTPVPPVPPGPICKIIVCFILLILNVVFAIIFVGIHSYLIWKKHDWAIKEITKNDFGKKACLPAGCVCCILVLTQFLIFYLADDVKGCAFPVHLILPIILMVLKDVAAVGIIGGFVHHRGTKTSGKAVKQEGNKKIGPRDADEELRLQKHQYGNVPLEQANGNSKTVGKIDRL